ncbi:hypothetical protein K461DRAFT_239502 [Myriangium duriaei CBS 260.36]|uniref:Protein transport protein BOS1 n=1 Tax=Myriangium duriaei CBS 260.36 TaxID=1168546 RepID=A0A9P4J249_9PEZI|nr:hypothetical protein K461DRAFT_239502 [Myriangium duriaei CBS 260.36]
MAAIFNSALRQSTALRSDLDAFQSAVDSSSPSPALQGQIATSITSFSRTLDTYSKQISAELVPEKKTRDEERLANYRAELLDYKTRFANLKHEAEEAKNVAARAELLGPQGGHHRRPHANATPENPYSDANVAAAARNGPGDSGRLFKVNNPNFQPSEHNPYSSYASPYGAGGDAREQHAYREQNFFGSANATLDEYIERGRAVLGDLGDQKEMLKGTQRKLYSVANTLGISGDTIRMVERRAKQDKWIFWAGVVIFIVFVYFVLKWLR